MSKLSADQHNVSKIGVVIAFATVYIAWGSTYFFIKAAITSFPPFMLGALRFSAAAIIMFIWCIYRKEKLFVAKQIKHAIVSGLLLLFIANGIVIWVEQYLPSAVVAIMVSSSPLWFVLLDKPKWVVNLTNKATVFGLFIGFVGVILLFYNSLLSVFSGSGNIEGNLLALITVGAMCWAGGSLYSKYYAADSSAAANTTWQMLAAAVAFGIVSFSARENLDLGSVAMEAWWALIYLVLFGSIAGFGAYVWLLKVKSAVEVSTYAYVNPVVAVLLGVFFAHEKISVLQVFGLSIILISVMLINFSKYRAEKRVLKVLDKQN